MGAESAPIAIFEAVRSIQCHYFCTPDVAKLLPQGTLFTSCEEVIGMEEEAVRAVKQKKKSSLVQGIMAMKEGTVDAFLSCANTGALVSAATLYLKTLPTVLKPALVTLFPAKGKEVVLLDVGAVLNTSAKRLVELARSGASFSSLLQGIKRPKVALLNIGSESGKGDSELKAAWKALQESAHEPFIFVGNLEPEQVFQGEADVVVTSGFAGNIFLKTAEATARFIHDATGATFIPRSQGALLAGVQGLVLKCHGKSTPEALLQAALFAKRLYEEGFLDKF